MGRVVHFEIHATDPERAVKFYSEMFDWSITKWQGPAEYWLISTGTENPGINGGLLRRHGAAPAEGQPVNAFVCTLGTSHLDQDLAQIGERGGSIALPKMAVPGIGWLAYGKDPEGNIFGLMQPDPQAK